MMSTVFVILLYSSGMPILYFVGVLWFGGTYLTNKLLILKFYQRTITMNRIIPSFSMNLIKAALIVHMFGASFMLTNPDPFQSEGKNADLIEFNVVDELELDSIKTFYEEHERTDTAVNRIFLKRFKYPHQQIFIIFLMGFAVTYLIGKSIYGVVRAIAKCFVSRVKRL